MDESFVVVTVISSVFGMITLFVLDRNWFRRQNYKLEMEYKRAKLNARLKREARADNFKGASPIAAPSPSLADSAKSLLPLLGKLAPDQIQDIIEVLTGGGGVDEDKGGLGGGIDGLLKFAESNPAIVKGFLDGLQKGKEGGGQDGGLA